MTPIPLDHDHVSQSAINSDRFQLFDNPQHCLIYPDNTPQTFLVWAPTSFIPLAWLGKTSLSGSENRVHPTPRSENTCPAWNCQLGISPCSDKPLCAMAKSWCMVRVIHPTIGIFCGGYVNPGKAWPSPSIGEQVPCFDHDTSTYVSKYRDDRDDVWCITLTSH